MIGHTATVRCPNCDHLCETTVPEPPPPRAGAYPRDAWEVARALQARGVAAGLVMDAGDAFHNEHVRARGTLIPVRHPDIPDEHLFPGPLWRFSDSPVTIRKPPVTLGEDNDYVYREVLGYSEEEYERFKEHGHVGTEYDASIP